MRFGILYIRGYLLLAIGICLLLSIGRFEEYDLDVSLDDTGEVGYEEKSDSSESSSDSMDSMSFSLLASLGCLGCSWIGNSEYCERDDRLVTLSGLKEPKVAILKCSPQWALWNVSHWM
jgi:hypothetical protein